MYIFYRGAVERPEMVMGVDWAEESVHTVPLPTQLVILQVQPSHWSDPGHVSGQNNLE